MQQRSILGQTLFMIVMIFRIAIEIVPIVSLYSNQAINMATLFFLYIVVFWSSGTISSIEIKSALMVCALLILQIIVGFFKGEDYIVRAYVFLQVFIWPLLGYYVERNCSFKQKEIIVVSIIIMIVSTMITTYIGCKLFPGITRSLATPDAVEEGLWSIANKNNIGGFKFVYIASLITPIFVYFAKDSGGFRKIVNIGLLVFMFFFIIGSGYTTALFVFIASILLFFNRSKFGLSFYLKVILTLSLLFLVFRFFVTDILYSAAHALNDNDISMRLAELGDIFSGADIDQTNDTSSRFEKWGKSVGGFLTNPILGSGIVGGHSYILDNMALYGVFGLVSLFFVFKGEYVCINRRGGYQDLRINGFCLFAFILNFVLCLVNTTNFIFVITFFYPVVLNLLVNTKNTQSNA